MELRKEKKRSLVLNVTSLIDVLFLLLIFFIVSTTFLSQPAIKLELPKAKHSEVVRQEALVIYIDKDGKLFLNDEPIEVQLLSEAITQKKSLSEEQGVILKADSRVSHGAVIQVMDILKGIGVKKLIVSTEFEK
jgi:biopolymer transport protein ExbD